MRLDLLALALLLGCGGGASDVRDASVTARVKAKSGQVWGRDLAQGLGLHSWELCAELGAVDCLSEAHLITLGGVEPERLGMDEPIQNPTASAPIAADRVALSACAGRLERDRAGTPALFGPVLEEDTPRAREQVAEALVVRLLGREPTQEEVRGLATDLYASIAATSADPVGDWSVGACMVVATSLEALFY